MSTEKKKILVVDDDPVYRHLLSFALDSAGYHALSAENGAEAMIRVEDSDPDLVIVDLLMPVMDGLRFVRWLRQEADLDTPAVVLTALSSRSSAVDAMVAGAAEVLVKPVNLPSLLERIEGLT